VKRNSLMDYLLLITLLGIVVPCRALVITNNCQVSGSADLGIGDIISGDVIGYKDDVTGEIGAAGVWQHTLPDSSVIVMKPDWVLCRTDGVQLADHGGVASINGVEGFTYRIHIQDFGLLGHDVHEDFPVEEVVTATHFYRPSKWLDGPVPVDGNWSRVTIPFELPVTTGAPGNGIAVILFDIAKSKQKMQCIYDGNGQQDAGGDSYVLRQCVGNKGSEIIGAGDQIDVTAMKLRVRQGDDQQFEETTITAAITVTPLTVYMLPGDFYRLTMWDESGIEVEFPTIPAGNIVSGDLINTPLDF